MPNRQPDVIDYLVGQNIRFFRSALRMTQEQLGAILGVSFQQIQKYEIAKNRIPASRLFIVSKVLHRRIDEFFDVRDFSRRTKG